MFRYISPLAYKFEPLIFIAVSLLLSVKILIFLPLRLEATELLDLELSLEVVPLSSAEAPTLKPQVTQLEDAADPWEMRAAVRFTNNMQRRQIIVIGLNFKYSSFFILPTPLQPHPYTFHKASALKFYHNTLCRP